MKHKLSKEELLKEIVAMYKNNPKPDIFDIYYRLSAILNDIKTIMENERK